MRCLSALLLVFIFVVSLISPSIEAAIASMGMCMAVLGLAIVYLAARGK